MLLAGMLASSLTLLPSWPVLVSFCLSPSVSAAWLWLLSWGLCLPGVLATIRVDYPASFKDMRSMDTVLRSLFRAPAYMLAPSFFGFLLCFHFLYAVLRFPFAPLGAALYGLRLYSAICFL